MKSHIKQSLITLDSIPDELKDFSKNIKNVNFQENNILKTVIMHEKGDFVKIKCIICNIPIKAANICNILPRPADPNGLFVVKLKRNLQYKGHV